MVQKYTYYSKKFIYTLEQSATGTELIFTKVVHALQLLQTTQTNSTPVS